MFNILESIERGIIGKSYVADCDHEYEECGKPRKHAVNINEDEESLDVVYRQKYVCTKEPCRGHTYRTFTRYTAPLEETDESPSI